MALWLVIWGFIGLALDVPATEIVHGQAGALVAYVIIRGIEALIKARREA
jgi:hypothetical protein